MATLIKTDGRVLEIHPLKGPEFSLDELKRIVGGYIEMIPLPDEPGKILVCNEEGKIMELPYNGIATERCNLDRIVGDVVIVDNTEVS